jgi:hypothetical protein
MVKYRVTIFASFFALWLGTANISMSQQSKAPKATEVPDFEVEGIGLTMCQCTAYACPCRSNGHPTHGGCDAADFAYFKSGRYGDVRLDGLKAVVIGNQIDRNPERLWATIYFDENTTPDQRAAFTALYKFMLSGWTNGAPYIKESKVAPIEFRESPDKAEYTLTIPGILEERAVMKRGKDGKPLSTLPAMDQWGNTIHYVDNVVFKYHDKEQGKQWDLSGRQANVKYFHTTKKMYDNKEMLAQHGDMSGTWTAKQKEIIQKIGMKPE